MLYSPSMSERPGRNEPCHCGSGSKYKKCHLEQDDAARIAAAAVQAAAVAAAPLPVESRTARPQQSAPKPQEASRRMAATARRRSV